MQLVFTRKLRFFPATLPGMNKLHMLVTAWSAGGPAGLQPAGPGGESLVDYSQVGFYKGSPVPIFWVAGSL